MEIPNEDILFRSTAFGISYSIVVEPDRDDREWMVVAHLNFPAGSPFYGRGFDLSVAMDDGRLPAFDMPEDAGVLPGYFTKRHDAYVSQLFFPMPSDFGEVVGEVESFLQQITCVDIITQAGATVGSPAFIEN